MTTAERITGARAYLAKLPAAVSGQGGHPATYRAASILAHGFDLPYDDAWGLLQEWNATHCSPPWSERDLRHKLNDAYVKPHTRPKGWLKGQQRAVGANGRMVFDPKAVAAIAFGEVPVTTAELLLAAFKDEDVIRITNEAGQTDDGKWFPVTKGIFLKRSEWLARFFGPDAKGREFFDGKPQGAWISPNPFQEGNVDGTDSSVASFRHVLVEFDHLPKEEQVAIFHQSNLPITALIDSGGKSVHAWVKVEADNRHQWEERRRAVYEFLADHEPDQQNKNPSRWSRLGGVSRGDKEQRIIALGVGQPDWDAWVSWKDGQDLPQPITTDFLAGYDIENDPNHVIGHGRWLCRGGSLLVTGQAGIGKSSFTMQMACSFALGRELFGIPVKQALRVGVVQAENDDGDLASAYQGVTSAMELSQADRDTLRENLLFYTETTKTGEAFAEMIRRIVVRQRLDFLICDPLLSYVGGDLSKQEVASHFLRNLIQPILKDTGCIICFVHHEGKPKPKEVTDGQTISDMAYSGLGSSELTNWARSIVTIRRESKDKPVFSFNLTKRGKLAGMRLPNGHPTLSLTLRHAEGKVLWEVCQPESKFKLLKVGQQYERYATKPKTSRGALVEELTRDFGLTGVEADGIVKALVENGILKVSKVGAVIFYTGADL
ncbi:MAG: AAA family ATPase [Opitutia bacterium]